jgi:FtsH-binding integral membrane protein
MSTSYGYGRSFAGAPATARADFVRRTYAHLAGAILAFVLVESLLLQWSGATRLAATMTGGWNWLGVLLAFGVVSYVAERWARSTTSLGVQYAGLALYVVAQGVLFLPLMLVATSYSDPTLLPSAALVTGFLFLGLTLVAFFSGADFSFLRGFLIVGGLVALGLIVASILIGFNLGLIFSGAMVVFAAGAILYQTSNVARYYRTDQYVAAALALFASVALLFWYVLRIFLAFRGD